MRRVAELSDDIFLRRREASRGVAVGITHLSQVSCVGRGCHCFVYALNEREVAKVYFHPVTPHSALENNVHAPPLDYRNAIESTRNACLSDVVVSSAIALLGEKHTFATARCVTARLNEVHLTDVRMCEEDARGAFPGKINPQIRFAIPRWMFYRGVAIDVKRRVKHQVKRRVGVAKSDSRFRDGVSKFDLRSRDGSQKSICDPNL